MQIRYYILIAVILVAYCAGMLVDVMAVDAAQYAEMSQEMLRTKSFLKLYCLGVDYLDKPPLLFWLNSVSFYLFGVSNFSYKLPSVFFALLGIYSTYRLARLYYSGETAIRAGLMLATTQALFLITNDVRTDTILMGAVIFAIWRWAEYLEKERLGDMLWGCVGIGLALLSKGPIGLIVVGTAILPQMLWQRKWRMLLRPPLLVGVGIIAAMLLPMCVGLYRQFGMEGLRFYFWTQSFGRITGESQWNNHPDTFFLLHTTAWAFMPWTLFLFPGWGVALVELVRRHGERKEILAVSGFTLTAIALMLSKYQLPHYIFVVYPLGAVMAADYFDRLRMDELLFKILAGLQILVLLAIIVVAFLLQYCFKGMDMLSMVCLMLLFPAGIVMAVRMSHTRSIFNASLAVIVAFNLLLSVFYFPAIMKYQPGGDFGRYVHQHKSKEMGFAMFNYLGGFEDVFYSQLMPVYLWDTQKVKELLNAKQHLLLITSSHGLEALRANGLSYKVVMERSSFRVAALNITFLNPATREGVCQKAYLVEIRD